MLEVRFGFNQFRQVSSNNLQFTSPSIAADVLKISGVSTDPASSNAPAFSVPGYNALDPGVVSTPRSWYSDRYEGQANVTMVRGAHQLRAGLHIVKHKETFPEAIIPNGLYSFDGTFTGHSMADMLLGIPSSFLLSPELFDPQFRQTDIMPWIQDDWRVTPKLTRQPRTALRAPSLAGLEEQHHLEHPAAARRRPGVSGAFRPLRARPARAALRNDAAHLDCFVAKHARQQRQQQLRAPRRLRLPRGRV